MLTEGSMESDSKFNRKYYEKRINAAYEIDPIYPAVLAARIALRVLPTLAYLDPLTFGVKQGRVFKVNEVVILPSDDRIIHLLSIFVVLDASVKNLILNRQVEDMETFVTDALLASSTNNKVLTTISGAALAAINNAILAITDTNPLGYVSTAAEYATKIASSNDAINFELEFDLVIAEGGISIDELVNKPLWSRGVPKDILVNIYRKVCARCPRPDYRD